MAELSRRLLAQNVKTFLAAGAPQVNVFLGAPDAPTLDPDGMVHKYACIWPAPGTRDQDRVVPVAQGLVWKFQVTCVGGDLTRCLACLDDVDAALTGRRIPVSGMYTGLIRQVGNSDSATEDRFAHPYRWMSALIYSMHVTRSS